MRIFIFLISLSSLLLTPVGWVQPIRTKLFSELYGLEKNTKTESSTWYLEQLKIHVDVPFVGEVEIRAGYFPASRKVPFRGNILYLEGLGDSMLNHKPLFEHLSGLGFRVIAFDYLGQGGSSGTMNHTRIKDAIYPSLNISTYAQKVYQRYFRDGGTPEKILMGWSTGGLAAYAMAYEGQADRVILFAPGIVPRLVVGEYMKITKESLTSAIFEEGEDPHLDPIRPNSPVLVPLFATNLLKTSFQARHWRMPVTVRGLVFLGGEEDRYVFSRKTLKVLEKKAPHFHVVQYEKARHEIDNEVAEIRQDVYRKLSSFLSSVP